MENGVDVKLSLSPHTADQLSASDYEHTAVERGRDKWTIITDTDRPHPVGSVA